MTTRSPQQNAIQKLIPINRLPAAGADRVAAACEFKTFRGDEVVYTQGDEDDDLYYLIDGAVELFWNTNPLKQISSNTKAANRAFDRPGRKRHTIKTIANSVIAVIPSALLEQEMCDAGLVARGEELEVSEIATEKSTNWMVRILQHDLFKNLTATNIQSVFAKMEKKPVRGDQVIIRQNDPADYYYVIERGYCEVTRKIPGSNREIHLADLGPGDAFGEEAIIGERMRGATVTMLVDGDLMQLHKNHFKELIEEPLLKAVDQDTALEAIDAGSRWLDVRYPEDYARAIPAASENIPLTVLRLQAQRLDREIEYIVCSDQPKTSRVGAFLLLERGVTVRYFDGSISDMLRQHPDRIKQRGDEQSLAGGRDNQDTDASEVINNKHPEESQQHTSMRGSDVSDNDYRSRLESTIERIDQLYADKERDLEESAKVPVADYAHTVTGQRLADLIDDMEKHHPVLNNNKVSAEQDDGVQARPVDVDVTGATLPVDHLSETVNPNILLVDTKRPLPVDVDLSGDPEETLVGQTTDIKSGFADDDIGLLMRNFESRVRAHVEEMAKQRTDDVHARYQDKLKCLRRAAAIEVRKRQEVLKHKYELRYKKKELALRKHYKKLMALANKVTEQKSQLHEAKRQFEDKLQAANALYREVEEMRSTLKEHLQDDPTTKRNGEESPLS